MSNVEMDAISKRDEVLKKLNDEVDVGNTTSTTYNSWVRGSVVLPTHDRSYPTDRCRFFDKHGFVLVPSFSHSREIEAMKTFMQNLVNNQWDPNQSTHVFRTDDKQVEAQAKSDYFLDSANKTHFFAEKDAMDENGNLKKEYVQNRIAALNKAGHGMHTTPGPFQTYTQSAKVTNLLTELGWEDPIVPQSMYIFKQAKIGGEVTSHQDSSFLYTTPRQTCIGLWLALDDATVENGCLWVRPGSHSEDVRRQFVRNPDHFGESLVYDSNNGDPAQPQMVFRQLNENGEVDWEGKLPVNSADANFNGLYKNGFIPIPCKAGDLLVFNGQVDHLSLQNVSSRERHTFQLHCIEGEQASVKWSNENWLQYPTNVPFMRLKPSK